MNIKFKLSSKYKHYKHEAFFNNKSIGFADFEFEEEGKYYVEFNSEAINLLSELSIEDIFNNRISHFTLKIDKKLYPNLDWGNEGSCIWFNNEGTCYLILLPDFLHWNKNLNVITLIDLLEKNLKEDNKIKFVRSKHILEKGLEFSSKIDINKNIEYEYNNLLKIIDKRIKLIFQEYKIVNEKNSLISVFSFPPEIQISCEQYLIYFSQFMKDLGVNVNSKIQVEAKETLFTVIPENKSQALEQIRDTLNIFLELAEIKDIELYDNSYHDIGVKQLISNIYHLKSQLMLSNSIIQMKDATIESLQLTNYRKTILLETNSKNQTNEEKTLSGLVTINELEIKGLKINLPEIFRRIKRRLK